MKAVLSILCIAFVSISSFAQTEISGITLPQKTTFGKDEVILNGAGVREKFWMDMYVGGLYVTTESSNPQEITKADEAMGIQLHIVSGLINSKKMVSAVEDGFENSTKGNKAALRDKIDKFIAVFDAEIEKEDVFDITYQPGLGTVIYKNGKESGTIKGFDFKKALIGIWLGDKPADKDLKKSMLGL